MADAKADWVQRVLGIDVAAAGRSAGQRPQPATGAQAASLQEQLDDINAQAALLPEPGRGQMMARIKQARASLAGADARAAATAIDTLATAVARAAGAARAGAAAAEAGNRVTYMLLQPKWQDAQGRARTQLQSFVSAVLNDPDLQGDKRFPQFKASAASVVSIIPDEGGALQKALAAFDAATDPKARGEARKQAQTALDAYLAKLEEAKGLKELQQLSDEDYQGIPFFTELRQVLGTLGTELAKAA